MCPTSGEERCVTTLITAAKETITLLVVCILSPPLKVNLVKTTAFMPSRSSRREYKHFESSRTENWTKIMHPKQEFRTKMPRDTTGVPSLRYWCVMKINFLRRESVSRHKQPLRLCIINKILRSATAEEYHYCVRR